MKIQTKISIVLFCLSVVFCVFGAKFYKAGERQFDAAAKLNENHAEAIRLSHEIGYDAAKRGQSKQASFEELNRFLKAK